MKAVFHSSGATNEQETGNLNKKHIQNSIMQMVNPAGDQPSND